MITENDKLTLKGLDIKAVAERLGLEVRQRGNSRCFNTSGHPNGDRNPSLSYICKCIKPPLLSTYNSFSQTPI